MAEDKITAKKKTYLLEQIAAFFFIVIAAYIAGRFYQISSIEQLRNVVLIMMGMACIIFRQRQIFIEIDHMIEESNARSIGNIRGDGICTKFFSWFFIGILLAIFFPAMPESGWPYPVLAVILALYSDTVISLLSVSLFLFISVSLAGTDFSIFYLYFSCSAISILLFQKLDEKFKIYIPLFLSLLSIMLSMTAEVLLMDAGRISVESFIIPVINVFISALFYLIFLKYYSATQLHKYQERYMTIADQEYSLMVDLKNRSKEAYYIAIHTAYFSDKIATKIKCDAMLVKAGSYYHDMKVLCEVNDGESYEKLLIQNEFPPALQELLLTYQDKKYISKEAGIIYLSDKIVNAVLYIFKNEPHAEPDYDKIIDLVFDKKLSSGILNRSELTMSDIHTMKSIFKEEKLYYDFLR